MAVDTQQILQAAEKLGQMLKDHPAVEKLKSAQKLVAEDAEASRMLAEFERGWKRCGDRNSRAGRSAMRRKCNWNRCNPRSSRISRLRI